MQPLYLGKSKKAFSTIIVDILQIIYVSSDAALAVYLLLFSASYYLHSPSTVSGACYRMSACMDILRLAAAACCDMG